MEKLFHSKSNFWLFHCSRLQIMNQRGTLQPCRPCALGDGLWRAMTAGMQICTTSTEPVVCCRYFCHSPCRDCCWTPRPTLRSSRCRKHNNTFKKIKVRQGWPFFSFLCLPFGALCPSLLSIEQVAKYSMILMLLTFWTINGPRDGLLYCCVMLIS